MEVPARISGVLRLCLLPGCTEITQKEPLLFEKYPDLKNKIPWMPLGTLPTPVHRLANLSAALQHDNLWIKRDDMTGEIYGGNKVRKLEFIIAHALKKNKKWILTFGGIGSNHALATTIYGQKEGFKTVIALIDQPVTPSVREKLLLLAHYGAKLSYGKNTLGAIFKGLWHLATKRRVYFLWAGGSNAAGILGYVDAALELAMQIDEGTIPSPEKIFIPVGTMGTYAGLKVGLTLAGIKTDLVGVRVAGLDIANERGLIKMINKTVKYLHSKSENIPDIKVQEDDIQLNHDFLGEGYGFETPEGKEGQILLKEQENITIETTYTAKAFAGMLDFVKNKKTNGGPILFWNTYNSSILPDVHDVDYKQLPRSFHKFFKEEQL